MSTTPVAVPSYTAYAPFPVPADYSTGTYSAIAINWANFLKDIGGPQHKALADNAYSNALAAQYQAGLAVASSTAAAASATAAENASTASAWISGTTYTQGQVRWSPINFASYRRKTNGAGTTDPSADGPNWQLLGAPPIPITSALTLAREAVITLATSIGSGVSGLAAVELDVNRELLVMHGSSSVHGVIYDASTSSFGTPVLLRTASAAIAKAVLVAADRVLVVTLPSSSTAMESLVLSTSGTTISVGTPVATTLADSSTTVEVDKLFSLGSAWVFEYTNGSGAPCLRAITVSGTTPTVGAVLTLSGFNGGPSFAVSSTVALIIRASNSQLFASPVSLSGTTLTLGTQAIATTTSFQGLIGGALSTGRYAVAYTNNTIFGAIVNVSGTVATISSVNLALPAGTASDRALHVVNAQAIVGATNGVNVLTDNAGAAVAGTALNNDEGVPFGRTTSTLLINNTNGRGSYFSIGISGNNPVRSYTYAPTLDNTATVSAWPSWRQGNGALGHLTLRTASGKHVALASGNAPPFGLSVSSGEASVRTWFISPGIQAYKGSSEASVWGFSLGIGNTVIVRKVEAS